jgi:hypothetical protein
MQKLAPMRRRVNQLIHIQDSISLPADEQQASKEEQRASAKENAKSSSLVVKKDSNDGIFKLNKIIFLKLMNLDGTVVSVSTFFF